MQTEPDWANLPFLRRAILWHQLRAIGNSASARLTILIPLVGYLIIFNDSVQRYIRLAPPFDGADAPAMIEPRLLSIYFGLCLVALGSFLFVAFCPSQVQKYGSPEEYIASEERFLSERGKVIVEGALAAGDEIAKKWLAELEKWNAGRPSPDGLEEVRRRGENLFRYKMHLYYEMLDRKYSSIRWIAAFAYAVGLLALLFPALRIFSRVCIILYRATIAELA